MRGFRAESPLRRGTTPQTEAAYVKASTKLSEMPAEAEKGPELLRRLTLVACHYWQPLTKPMAKSAGTFQHWIAVRRTIENRDRISAALAVERRKIVLYSAFFVDFSAARLFGENRPSDGVANRRKSVARHVRREIRAATTASRTACPGGRRGDPASCVPSSERRV